MLLIIFNRFRIVWSVGRKRSITYIPIFVFAKLVTFERNQFFSCHSYSDTLFGLKMWKSSICAS